MKRSQLSGNLGELEAREEQPLPLSRSLGDALRGAVFPLSAEQVLVVARENEAPSALLTLLGALPRARFGSLDAVGQALEGGAPDTLDFGAEPPPPHR